MITIDDAHVSEKTRIIRVHGSKHHYLHELMGYNYLMIGIAAAIVLVQLDRIDEFNSAGQKNASVLSDGLQDLNNITTSVVGKEREHVYHQYTIRTENRDNPAEYSEVATKALQLIILWRSMRSVRKMGRSMMLLRG